MTKFSTYAMIFCISLTVGICSTAGAQQKLLREISIELDQKDGSSLLKVFKEIEKTTDFQFLYSQREIKEKSVELEAGIWNMDDLLHKISSQAKLSIKRVNGTISVTAVDSNPEVTESVTLQQQISGTITDESGEGLPGASIVVTGTAIGTITDIDGKYSLAIPADAQTVDVSFVGMKTMTVPINGRSVIDVQLSSDVGQLEEVVVIGFGSKLRKDLTGSIASVEAKDIEKTSFLSPQYALQGNAPGVRVVNTSGDPNAQPQIQVRGIGTWNGRAQPLYVIDGQIINDPSDFGNQDVIAGAGRQTPLNLWNLINPQDIESVTVLKDASAAAIYGSRAANGVVLITTKSGKTGAPTVEFSVRQGWSSVPREDRMLNSEQWVNLYREAHNNSTDPTQEIGLALYGNLEAQDIQLETYTPQMNPASPYYINESTATNYDWQDYLLRTASDKQYDVKLSGGTEKMDYYLSVGYKNQEHPHYGNSAERYTAAVNINAEVTNWLKIGVNYKFASSENNVEEENMMAIIDHAPWQPVYAPAGTPDSLQTNGYHHVIAPPDSIWQPLRIFGQGGSGNHLAHINSNVAKFIFQRNIVQAYAELTPLKGLKIRGSINLDQTQQNRFTINQYFTNYFSEAGIDVINPQAPSSVGSIAKRRNWFNNYQADLTVTYDRSFGNHNASILLGVQDTYRRQEFGTSSGANIPFFNPIEFERTGYANDVMNNSSTLGYGDAYWFGYVARAGYNYDSKYYLDVSFRRDASSGFAEEYRWGNFYSVAGAWRISSESFMDGATFISDLKLRGGYGEAGNDEAAVGNFAFLSTVNQDGSVRFGSGNGDPTGIYYIPQVASDFPNFGLSWETVATTYVGFDAYMIDNRLSLTTEFYQRKTKGILQRVNLSPALGTGNPLFNLGELTNEGIDIDLMWNDRIGEFEYGIGGNVSLLRNEITKLYNDQPFFVSDPFGGPDRRIEIGRSIGHIWGYVVEGIYQNQQEIDDRNAELNDVTVDLPYVGPGDMYFKNVGGNPDSVYQFYSPVPDTLLNSFDQTEIGDNLPDFIYGFNVNLGWKGIDVTLSFYGEAGVDKINAYRRSLESMTGGGGQNKLNTTLQRWTSENPSTTMPRAVAGDPAGNNRGSSTRWIESADFLRLNNWQVGYSLPTSLLSRMNNVISNARFYVGGQNNLLITNWSGLDPVNDMYPLPRTFLVGLNVKF